MKDRIARLRTGLRNDKGFTLVELLVTVTIIGILAAVVTVGVSGVASSSQVKANQALFSAHQTLIDAWLAANPLQDPDKSVPTNTTFSCTGTGTGTAACGNTDTTFKWYAANGDISASRTFEAVAAASGNTITTTTAVFRSVNPTADVGDSASTYFKKFFRLGNAASSTVCVVNTAATNNVIACKN